MVDFEKIVKAMGELEEETVINLLEQVMQEGGENAQDAMAACQKGMEVVGKRFEDGEYFVGDLIYAGELMTSAVNILKDALVSKDGQDVKAKLILCTVQGDLHDIGKNIVRSMLEANGFEVVDLGIDCPPEKIVETAQSEDIKIIALSGVLTLALNAMKDTVAAFASAGLRDGVKIIIGGTPVNEAACVDIGADEWAYSPQKTVDTCRAWAKNE